MSKQRIVLVIFDSLAWWIFQKFVERYPGTFIARMAKDGLSFERCYATCTFSYPSYPSMLYGVYPYKHGVLSKVGYKLNRNIHLSSIHESLEERGWGVATYSDEAWIFEEDTYGFNCHIKGEAYFYDTGSSYEGKQFLLLNYWGTHHPWSLTKPYDTKAVTPNSREMLKAFQNKDWVKVAFIREKWISRIFENLLYYDKRLESLDDGHTYIIVCSDHGEDIYLHGSQGGMFHAGLPWETVLRVPLILYPYPQPKKVDILWSNVYLKQMILELSEGFDARKIDIRRLASVHITGGKVDEQHSVASAGYVFDRGIKYFVEGMVNSKPKEHLYLLKEDRSERVNRLNDLPEGSVYERFWLEEGRNYRGELKKHYPFIFDSDLFAQHIHHIKDHTKEEEEKIKERLQALGYA